MSKSVRPFVTLCDLLRGDRRLSFVSHSVISVSTGLTLLGDVYPRCRETDGWIKNYVVDLMSGSTARAVTVYQDVPA